MSVTKLLIANRGEIACRVISTAENMGIPCVAVYSDADAEARHAQMASEAIHIGPSEAAASYLRAEVLIEAAKKTGCDAIHPGYGFLSENAAFSEACAEAGITFVGPPAAAIQVMGDKARSKDAMEKAEVPCVPGFRGEGAEGQETATLVKAAADVGFPLLVKAAAGGGGRGMRRVDAAEDLEAAIQTARSEAEAAFGNGTLLMERLVEGARHVEVQVFADTHGQVIHLGERDCSSQRRHQKVIEEAPCPVVDPELRERMGSAAVRAAQAVDYVGAGTVEFLLDGDGNFYFLEMNTRLQVEHPVTELVTGLDLVALQLAVAAGEPLGLTQEDVTLTGHAIEARLYAEDPAQGFIPSVGAVLAWDPPTGDGVRCDHGLAPGQAISSYYDPMVAKVMAYGENREEARRRLRMALDRTVLLGPKHNRAFLRALLDDATFIAGDVTTGYLEGEMDPGLMLTPSPDATACAIAAALWLENAANTAGPSVWSGVGARPSHLTLEADGERHSVRAQGSHGGGWSVEVDGGDAQEVRLEGSSGATRRVSVDGHRRTIHRAWDDQGTELYLRVGDAETVFTEVVPGADREDGGGGSGRIEAPMSGRVLAVHVSPGDQVESGQALLVVEAMKLETTITSPIDGVVESVRVSEGDQVSQRDVMVMVTAPSEEGGEGKGEA